MKQSKKMEDIQSNMKPGSLSAEGFMGEDTRSLEEIILEDTQVVKKLNLSHEQIAERMAAISDEAQAALGKPIVIDSSYEASVEEFMGQLSCPFQDNAKTVKNYTLVKRLATGQSLRWTDMNIHMIGSHGFYEGRGSAYRLDPAELAEFLGLASRKPSGTR